MARFRIRTNWTNSVSVTHEFTLDDLADGAARDKLKWAMSDPERLRPGETRQAVTERAAATFAELAQDLRDRGQDPQTVAHFINRLVFCMFAEDVGLLPGKMFTKMLEQARRRPANFATMASILFGAMAHKDGLVGFEPVAWFNGGLFDDNTALPLDREGIETTLKAAALDWSEIDPSIFGTLFERGLDPDKRSQLGAHYTDRDKIMRIVDPVLVRPLLAEWDSAKCATGPVTDQTTGPHPLPLFDAQATDRSDPLMSLTRILVLTTLAAQPMAPALGSQPCTAPQGALAYVLDRQDAIDELRAGGHGPLRIAYLHPPDDTRRDALTRRAKQNDLELRTHLVSTDARDLPGLARQVAKWRPDWVLVSAGPAWHGAILAELSRAEFPSSLVIPFDRAAHHGCPPNLLPR